MTLLFVLVFLVWLGIAAALFFLQRSILYQPMGILGAPDTYHLTGFKALKLTSDDGLPLTVWESVPAPGMPTILYFHGNSGHLGDRGDAFSGFALRGFGVLALSYRGFGDSGGAPTETGLYQDARTLIAYARGTMHLEDRQIILFGESLGSGIAVQMATEMNPAMLVLESPYTSIIRRGQALYPYMPVTLLLRDRFDSIGKIGNIHTPLLIFHGDQDRVVPSSDGRALLAKAPEPKKGLFYPDRGHVDFPGTLMADEIHHYAIEQGILASPVANAPVR